MMSCAVLPRPAARPCAGLLAAFVVLAAGLPTCSSDSDASAPDISANDTVAASDDAELRSASTDEQTSDAAPDGPQEMPVAAIVVRDAPEAEAPAGQAIALTIVAQDAAGAVVANAAVHFSIERGGGQVAPAEGITDASGKALCTWTLGQAPVLNRLRIAAGDVTTDLDLWALLAEPLQPEPFADVDAYLTSVEAAGSTEDLAFDSQGRLILGIPGGLLALDAEGQFDRPPLTGDPLVRPLGIAYDRQGVLWVADSEGHALRRVDSQGNVTTALTNDGITNLIAPNFVAVDPAGRILLSDPCLGSLLRFDPIRQVVDAAVHIERVPYGGPNGFAFDPSGTHLWLATENTRLFCQHADVPMDAPNATLFSIPVSDEGFGSPQAMAEAMGLFGDGLTFDAEGNLYVIFDRQENLQLSESTVWVLPEGRDGLVPFLRVTDHVLANLQFGQPPFDPGTLYIALLAVPPFTPASARGLERYPVGIAGLPLVP